MDKNSLSAFIAVAEARSFSKAAQQLLITQSAVSKRIAQLESGLEQQLFDRIGRRITLTEAGSALLPRARAILAAIDDAGRAMGNLSGKVQGVLSLAASHHISLHRLPPVLRAYVETFPDVQLNLRFQESEAAYEAVLQGELELAIITLSPHPDPALCAQRVWTDRLQYVVAKDHPLASTPEINLQALNQFAAILPAPNTFTRQIVAEQFHKQGLELRVEMSTNYLDTIRMMVSIGLGWSLLPETMIDNSLQVLNTHSAPIERDLGYIFHRERTLSNAASQLMDILRRLS